MENSSTVRIDLQRLQVLNDRLCQTLEALNQVRMSAHNMTPGFGHSYGYNMGYVPQQQMPMWGASHPMFHNGFVPSYGAFHGYNNIPAWNHQHSFAPMYAGHHNSPFTGYPIANGLDRSRMPSYAQPTLW